MKRNIYSALISCVAAVGMSGCAMCCTPYLNDYPTYGGRVERTNREWGRVGSVFSDPNMVGATAAADSNLRDYEFKPAKTPPGDTQEISPPIEVEELPSPILENQKTQPNPLIEEPQPDDGAAFLEAPGPSQMNVPPRRVQTNRLRGTYR
jgi:hypothetical protein